MHVNLPFDTLLLHYITFQIQYYCSLVNTSQHSFRFLPNKIRLTEELGIHINLKRKRYWHFLGKPSTGSWKFLALRPKNSTRLLGGMKFYRPVHIWKASMGSKPPNFRKLMNKHQRIYKQCTVSESSLLDVERPKLVLFGNVSFGNKVRTYFGKYLPPNKSPFKTNQIEIHPGVTKVLLYVELVKLQPKPSSV